MWDGIGKQGRYCIAKFVYFHSEKVCDESI